MKHSCQCQNIRNNTDLEDRGLQEVTGGFGHLYHCNDCKNSLVLGFLSYSYLRKFFKEHQKVINNDQ